MTYQPVIPYGGMAGWAFLQRTQEAQQDAFEKKPGNPTRHRLLS